MLRPWSPWLKVRLACSQRSSVAVPGAGASPLRVQVCCNIQQPGSCSI